MQQELMKIPEGKQSNGTEQIQKSITQGNAPYREPGLKFHTEEAYHLPGQINPETYIQGFKGKKKKKLEYRQKDQITYKGKKNKLSSEFSTAILYVTGQYNDMFQEI